MVLRRSERSQKLCANSNAAPYTWVEAGNAYKVGSKLSRLGFLKHAAQALKFPTAAGVPKKGRVLDEFVFNKMLETIAVILLILWFLGVVTSYTIGGFINLLLVIAIIMVLLRVIRGENPVK